MTLTDNKYTDVLFSLYESIYIKNDCPKYIKKWLFKKEILSEDLKMILTHTEDIYNELKNVPMTYKNLCYFADFIRVLEKVYFYDNSKDTDTSVICDSPWDSNSKRIIIRNEKYTITLFMEFDYDAVLNKTTIEIDHHCGYHLKNNFVIFDNEFNFTDQSDLMLINNINRIIGIEFSKLFKTYIDKIKNHEL